MTTPQISEAVNVALTIVVSDVDAIPEGPVKLIAASQDKSVVAPSQVFIGCVCHSSRAL